LIYLERALALARRRGSRTGEWSVLSETTYPLFMRGRWDEALVTASEIPEEHLLDTLTLSLLSGVLEIRVRRGELAEAQRLISLYEPFRESPDVQNRCCFLAGAACVARADGRLEDAVREGVEAVRITREDTGFDTAQPVKQGIVEAIDAALALGDTAHAEELVSSIEAVPAGLRSEYLAAHAIRFRGRLAGAGEQLAAAAAQFGELRIPFWQAVGLLEHGELTGDEVSLAEARAIFEQLRAAPWLERLADAVGSGERLVTPVAD
jgi:hypothetical protein